MAGLGADLVQSIESVVLEEADGARCVIVVLVQVPALTLALSHVPSLAVEVLHVGLKQELSSVAEPLLVVLW